MALYFLSHSAQRELDDIWDFFSDNVSDDEANRQIERILDHFDLLVEYPHLGRPRPEFLPDIRSHIVHPYMVWYYIWADQIEISRVAHGSQDITRLFEDAP